MLLSGPRAPLSRCSCYVLATFIRVHVALMDVGARRRRCVMRRDAVQSTKVWQVSMRLARKAAFRFSCSARYLLCKKLYRRTNPRDLIFPYLTLAMACFTGMTGSISPFYALPGKAIKRPTLSTQTRPSMESFWWSPCIVHTRMPSEKSRIPSRLDTNRDQNYLFECRFFCARP